MRTAFIFPVQLFSSFVDVPVQFLPEEARMIHTECKGSPMVISMIGGLISETGRHQQKQRQSGRWAYYLNNLRSRRYSESHSSVPYNSSYFSTCFFLQVSSRSSARTSTRA